MALRKENACTMKTYIGSRVTRESLSFKTKNQKTMIAFWGRSKMARKKLAELVRRIYHFEDGHSSGV